MTRKPLRAWCDAPGHIVIRIGDTDHGFELENAQELFEQLGLALIFCDALETSEKVIKSVQAPATMRTHNKPGDVIL